MAYGCVCQTANMHRISFDAGTFTIQNSWLKKSIQLRTGHHYHVEGTCELGPSAALKRLHYLSASVIISGKNTSL